MDRHMGVGSMVQSIRQLGIVLVLGSIVLGVLLLTLDWARREPAFESAWILYSADYDGEYRIYRTLPNGGRAEVLTPRGAWAIYPSWNPDGSAFIYGAFVAGANHPTIKHYDMQTGHIKTVLDTDTNGIASWSPDGTTVAVINEVTNRIDLLDLNTRQRTPILSQAGIQSLHWSPDGVWVVYVADYQSWREVYRVSRDGSQQERLTTLRAGVANATWSPDGRTILFSTTAKSNWDIYQLQVSIWNPTPLTSIWINEIQPQWSPDGQWIMFLDNRTGYYRLQRMRPDGSDMTTLNGRPKGNEQTPAWGPTIDLTWHWELLAGLAIGSTILGGWLRRPHYDPR